MFGLKKENDFARLVVLLGVCIMTIVSCAWIKQGYSVPILIFADSLFVISVLRDKDFGGRIFK